MGVTGINDGLSYLATFIISIIQATFLCNAEMIKHRARTCAMGVTGIND